jgi:hypothetical protein
VAAQTLLLSAGLQDPELSLQATPEISIYGYIRSELHDPELSLPASPYFLPPPVPHSRQPGRHPSHLWPLSP